MDWFKQNEEMIKEWSEAQQQFWAAWQHTMEAESEPSAPYTQLFEQWRTLAAQTLENWPGSEDSIARQVAQQYFASQTAMIRFLELAIKAWAGLAPNIAQGQNWQDALRAYSDQMRQQVAGAYAETTRELNEQIARGFNRWLDYRRAEAEYHTRLADVWAEAFEQLLRDMAAIVEKGGQPDSLRDLLRMWGEAADRVFIKAFHTDDYVQMQGRFLNAAMAYRVQQREIIEVYLRLYDIPTRSEVDEAHHNIYELRKEIKALKQQVAQLQQPAPRKASKSQRD